MRFCSQLRKNICRDFFSLSFLMMMGSCGRPTVISSGQKPKSGKERDAASALLKNTVTITNLETADSKETTVAKNLGARVLLLGPQALSQTISKCFGANPRRGGPNQDYFNANSTKMFTVFEERALGKREVFNSGDTRAAGNPIFGPKHITKMKTKSDVNQEYLHALRSFLGTGCRNLIDEELATLGAQKSNESTKNKLVQAEVPTASHVSHFMSCLYGFAPTEGLHEGAEDYAKLFTANLDEAEAKKDRKTAVSKNYHQLCIALGSDPRFFTR